MLETMTDEQSLGAAFCRIRPRIFHSVVLAVVFAFSVLGCRQESQIDRKPIYGKIVGAEGRNGLVTFIPMETSIGPAAIGSFEDGTYRFTKTDGPVPGEYNVSLEFEESDSSPVAPRNGRGRRVITKNPADVGRATFEPAKTTTALVPVDGPFEIDLHLTKSASQ